MYKDKISGANKVNKNKTLMIATKDKIYIKNWLKLGKNNKNNRIKTQLLVKVLEKDYGIKQNNKQKKLNQRHPKLM